MELRRLLRQRTHTCLH
jgi:hypothetical protein